jgi:hypothetical protein
MDETEALLKILELGRKEVEAGATFPLEEVINEIRARSKSLASPYQPLQQIRSTVE